MNNIKEYIELFYPEDEFTFLEPRDQFDDCIIGVSNRFNQNPILAYDVNKIIKVLEKDMSKKEAMEYFDYNIIGGWFGDSTPCFIEKEDE